MKTSIRRISVFYVFLLIVTCAVMSGYAGYLHYDSHLSGEAEMLSVTADQMSLTARLYFKKMEDTSLALLSNSQFLAFDADDESMDQYDKQQTLNAISNKVSELSVMDNYCDFAVVYKNNVYAGTLADQTREAFEGESGDMYLSLREAMGEARSIWITGKDHDKVFFVREVNENACFVGGFYMSELEELIKAETNWDSVRLLVYDNAGRRVINLGNTALEPMEPSDDVSEEGSYSLISRSKIQENKQILNGWSLVLIRDMQELGALYRKIFFEIAAMLMIAIVALVVYSVVNSRGVGFEADMVRNSPAIDDLTGVNNAEAAENLIADKIETCISGSTILLALVRISNLADIAKKYDRSAYNGAIIKTYRALAQYFGTDDKSSPNIIGRTGENEFVVFADFTEYDLFKAHDRLRNSIEQLSLVLNTVHIQSNDDIIINMGGAIYPDSSTDYDELYDIASAALEEAEQSEDTHCVLHRKDNISAEKGAGNEA